MRRHERRVSAWRSQAPFSFGSVTNRGAKTVSELVALDGVVFAGPPPVLATLCGPEKCQKLHAGRFQLAVDLDPKRLA